MRCIPEAWRRIAAVGETFALSFAEPEVSRMTNRFLYVLLSFGLALGCGKSTGVVADGSAKGTQKDAEPNAVGHDSQSVAAETNDTNVGGVEVAGSNPASDAAQTSDASASSDTATGRDSVTATDSKVAVDVGSEAPGCTSTLAPGNYTRTMTWDGAGRNYLLHVPTLYDGSKPVPLVIDMHGWTETAAAQAARSGWRQKGDKVGFIVVQPNGLNNSWNGGSLCCGISQATGVDDEGFMRAIVTKTRAEACIDPKRVYATGFSNGGAMSHLLGCKAADVFAAVAPVSMGNGTNPCKPSRPLSVVLYRGTSDPLVAYGGGLFPSAKADFDQWKSLNGCTGQAIATHGLCQTYQACSAGTQVTLCTIDAGHDLYATAAAGGAAVADVAWEAFAAAPMP
jgi:polyhydroxybutyrate depolymerase